MTGSDLRFPWKFSWEESVLEEGTEPATCSEKMCSYLHPLSPNTNKNPKTNTKARIKETDIKRLNEIRAEERASEEFLR